MAENRDHKHVCDVTARPKPIRSIEGCIMLLLQLRNHIQSVHYVRYSHHIMETSHRTGMTKHIGPERDLDTGLSFIEGMVCTTSQCHNELQNCWVSIHINKAYDTELFWLKWVHTQIQ